MNIKAKQKIALKDYKHGAQPTNVNVFCLFISLTILSYVSFEVNGTTGQLMCEQYCHVLDTWTFLCRSSLPINRRAFQNRQLFSLLLLPARLLPYSAVKNALIYFPFN